MDHNRKNARVPDFEDESAILFRLVSYPNKAGSKRLKDILDLVGVLHRKGKSKAEAMWAITQLRKALSIYQWSCQIASTREGYRTVLKAAPANAPENPESWEYEAVRDLLALVNAGKRPHIRPCRACGGLFLGKGKQDFCDQNCKQRHYDSSPERREDKRAYMKKAREDAKKRAKNPKSGVGLARTKRSR